jgi:hypothetical protein
LPGVCEDAWKDLRERIGLQISGGRGEGHPEEEQIGMGEGDQSALVTLIASAAAYLQICV